MMMVGSGRGHYPVNRGGKNLSALDYFSGRFTFKATPPLSVFSVGEKDNLRMEG